MFKIKINTSCSLLHNYFLNTHHQINVYKVQKFVLIVLERERHQMSSVAVQNVQEDLLVGDFLAFFQKYSSLNLKQDCELLCYIILFSNYLLLIFVSKVLILRFFNGSKSTQEWLKFPRQRHACFCMLIAVFLKIWKIQKDIKKAINVITFE